MQKLSRIWSGAVAYLALATGSGLSIAGNVADTYRIRGQATDTLDIVMAVAWPALVLLAIEMFVSRLWPVGQLAMQCLRWFGCLAIGFMAMYASWHHLHDLMADRGQDAVVSVIGPLAIDGLAIMATGLLLSSRTRQPTAGRSSWTDAVDTLATGEWYGQMDIPAAPTVATPAVPVVMTHEAMQDAATTQLGQELASEVENYLSTAPPGWVPPMSPVPVVRALRDHISEPTRRPAPLPRRMSSRLAAEQLAECTDLIMAAMTSPDAPRPSEVDTLLAAHYDVSTRTIRRIRAQLTGQPTSGAGGMS